MVRINNTSAFVNNDNIFMAARFTYIPTSVQATGQAWGIRKKVWKFKDGDVNTSSEVAQWVSKTLDENLPGLEGCTLVCIPASTQERTCMRYEQFAGEVCKATKMATDWLCTSTRCASLSPRCRSSNSMRSSSMAARWSSSMT